MNTPFGPTIRSIRRGIVSTAASAALACLALLGETGIAAEPAASSPAAESFVGTAYQKAHHTVWLTGKSYGMAQMTARMLVAQCHAIVGASPASPPENVLIDLDVRTHEKFFDTDKALTLISGHGLELTDMMRWSREARTGALPSPPDCGAYKLVEVRSGTLWRDGTRYLLRHATSKALSSRGPSVYAKRVLSSDDEWSRAPVDQVMGQRCRQVSTPPTTAPFFTGGSTCIWERFAHVGYLNWPFALSGHVDFVGKTLVDTIETVDVWSDRSIPPSVFEIPSGFTVTVN